MPVSIPEQIKPEGASPRALGMLNGRSRGSTAQWDFGPDDYLVATVTVREEFEARFNPQRTTRLTLLVEEGSECGVALPEHCHRLLVCLHQELRRMALSLNPHEGDVLALWYGGRDDSRAPSRHLWRYSIDKGSGGDADNSF